MDGAARRNWGIINGAESLHVHVIRYTECADEENFLDMVKMDISPLDDINTIQQKYRVVFNRIAEPRWASLERGDMALSMADPDREPMYYPKRSPEDGLIDF